MAIALGADECDVLNMVVELSKLACFTTFGIEQLYNNLNIMFEKKKKIVRTNKKGPGYVGNLKCWITSPSFWVCSQQIFSPAQPLDSG